MNLEFVDRNNDLDCQQLDFRNVATTIVKDEFCFVGSVLSF